MLFITEVVLTPRIIIAQSHCHIHDRKRCYQHSAGIWVRIVHAKIKNLTKIEMM